MYCKSCIPDSVSKYPQDLLAMTERHPCYSKDAHEKYARMHLPVAPKCNISCNYCNRKFSCVNESRPGVTAEILNPEQALNKFLAVKKKIFNLSVVGIAGPGDALANWPETLLTIQKIKVADPKAIFCISTNGLLLKEHATELVANGIKHVTVTVNAIDPAIGAKIYKYVIYNGQKYQGIEAAQILLDNQLQGIKYLTVNGVMVKINIVMIKGVNEHHIPEVVKKVKELGVFITNIMPLIPAPGSVFENYPQTSTPEINAIRKSCEVFLPQMRHCKQCRADAIGMLDNDISAEFRDTVKPTQELPLKNNSAPEYRIAVASKYGRLVDQHFGHATEFTIYEEHGDGFKVVEKREVAKYCEGSEECDAKDSKKESVIATITDCDAVLTMRVGHYAKQRLLKNGIEGIEYCDSIEEGLKYAVNQLVSRR